MKMARSFHFDGDTSMSIRVQNKLFDFVGITFNHCFRFEEFSEESETVREWSAHPVVVERNDDDAEYTETYPGKLTFYLISTEASFWDCDIDADLLRTYEVINNPRLNIMDDLDSVGDVLYLQSLEIDPDFRGRNIGLHLIHHTCKLFAGKCSLALMLPCPLNFKGSEEEGKTARRKLIRYYRRLGFQKIKNTDYYGYDLAYNLVDPPGIPDEE
jgi:ribosomal protein S18 acetylase RimI-like enzyme